MSDAPSTQSIADPATVLAQLNNRLLDLSARNKFINFKNPFEDNSNAICLKDTVKINFHEKSEKEEDWIIPVEEISDYFEGTPATLPIKLTKFRKANISSIEETGASCLFLAHGFLRYIDEEKKLYWAPIYLVPVSIEVEDHVVKVTFSDTPAINNFALIEKIKKTCQLPLIEEDTPEEYFNRISHLVPPSWILEKSNCLVKLSSINMVLFNDLKRINEDPDFHGKNKSISYFLDPDVFNKPAQNSLPQLNYTQKDYPQIVTDADSSQMEVIYRAVHEKDSFVIEGPPGTGKSQTITNIISSLIATGKKVLFVSEKLAALEVVKSRLEQAKLGPFIFSLHNPKTSKKEVIKQFFQEKDYPLLDMPQALNQVQSLKTKIQQACSFYTRTLDPEFGLTPLDLVAKNYFENKIKSVFSFKPTLEFKQWANEYTSALLAIDGYSISDTLYPLNFDITLEPDLALFEDNLAKMNATILAKQFIQECGLSYLKEKNIDVFEFANTAKMCYPLLDNYSIEFLDQVATNWEELTQYVVSLESPPITDEEREQLAALDQEIFEQNEFFVEYAYAHGNPIKKLDKLSWEVTNKYSLVEICNVLRAFIDTFEQIPVSFYASLGISIEAPARILEEILEVLSWLKLQPFEDSPFVPKHLIDYSVEADLKRLCFIENSILALRKELADNFNLNELEDLFLEEDQAFCQDMINTFDTESQFIFYLKLILNYKNVKQFNQGFQFFTNPEGLCSKLSFRDKLTWMTLLLQYIKAVTERNALMEQYKINVIGSEKIEELLQSVQWLLAFPKNVFKLEVVLSKLDQFNPMVAVALSAIREYLLDLDLIHVPIAALISAKTDLKQDLENIDSFLEDTVYFHDRKVSAYLKAISLKQDQLSLTQRIAQNKITKPSFIPESVPDVMSMYKDMQTLRALNPNNYSFEAMLDIKSDLDYYLNYSAESDSVLISKSFEHTGLSWNVPEQVWQDQEYCHFLREYLNTHSARISYWVNYFRLRHQGVNCGYLEFIEYCESNYMQAQNMLEALMGLSDTQYLIKELNSLDVPNNHLSIQDWQVFNKFDSLVVHKRGYCIGRSLVDTTLSIDGHNSPKVRELTEQQMLQHLQKYPGARVPLRTILSNISKSLMTQKPCFMMGPQAIAQFLDPNVFQFDVVIIDEASQMRLEHSIGALLRSKRCIIVGDPKQLGPTGMHSLSGAQEDSDTDTLLPEESVLTWALKKYNAYSLKWHYRSIQPSLIEFSNKHFYDKNLIVFPCANPFEQDQGLSYQFVQNGFFEQSINQKEAQLIVDKCVYLMEKYPTKSLGVITTNEAQAEYIEAAIKSKRFTSIAVRDYLLNWAQSAGNRFFVKNIENVQGDERDTIIVSLGYGPSFEQKELRQHFGAFSREDGWQRLNVIITRAKEHLIVYSSLKASDITDPSTTGLKKLQLFLDFCESANLKKNQLEVQDAPAEFVQSDFFKKFLFETVYQKGLNMVSYEENNLPCEVFRVTNGYKNLGLVLGPAKLNLELRDTSRILPTLLANRGWKNIFSIDPSLWVNQFDTQVEAFSNFLETISCSSVLQDDLTETDESGAIE